jgi:hypothetical protein
MKKLIKIVFAAIFSLTNHGFAAEQTSTPELNTIMTEIGVAMVDVYPLFVAKRALTDSEIRKIKKALTQMTRLFQQAKSSIKNRPDGYQVSYDFISQYLMVVEAVVAARPIDFARSYLLAIGEICASCHTQDTTLRTLFAGTSRDQFEDDYAFAELNYMTRDYDEAIVYYEKFLNTSRGKTELEIIQPLQRMVTIHTQIRNQPSEGIRLLKKFESLKDHTPETRAELQGWINGLSALEASDVGDIKQITFQTLEKYANQYLGDITPLTFAAQSTPQQEVERVWLRGQLYHYLNQRASANEIPKLLYWISVTDRSISYSYYFSLADIYLKQCVLEYPKHPYAKRCIAEYKTYMHYTYTRRGLKIPSGIQAELAQMENALK